MNTILDEFNGDWRRMARTGWGLEESNEFIPPNWVFSIQSYFEDEDEGNRDERAPRLACLSELGRLNLRGQASMIRGAYKRVLRSADFAIMELHLINPWKCVGIKKVGHMKRQIIQVDRDLWSRKVEAYITTVSHLILATSHRRHIIKDCCKALGGYRVLHRVESPLLKQLYGMYLDGAEYGANHIAAEQRRKRWGT